tara:strand:+ start:566 stop:967 length:402 start_codon:yes stop_codon:yes gene_type:complete
MPSKRKRIGYLASINAQEKITKIANEEKLSQSKVVGILVEEALIARGEFELRNSNDPIRKNLYDKENYMDNTYLNFNDFDELISDKGVTYNTKMYNYNTEVNSYEPIEKFSEELFNQFKQFILFQKKLAQDQL